ncbi:hypothetical protein ACO2Q3_21020 [Caulobacter sp. KR2-114]|uniref:hypothetical protein n=1 Tax=Caulobacter sp. KR2-114 TaxID=3400912 RepID=UPI003C07A04B
MAPYSFVQPGVGALAQSVPDIAAGDGALPAQAAQRPLSQQAPQTYGAAPLGAAQDPRSQYLMAALNALRQSASQDAPRTPMALGSDLLAEALDRYGLAHQQKQAQQQAFGQQLGQDFDALQGRNQAFAASLANTPGPNIIPGW